MQNGDIVIYAGNGLTGLVHHVSNCNQCYVCFSHTAFFIFPSELKRIGHVDNFGFSSGDIWQVTESFLQKLYVDINMGKINIPQIILDNLQEV